MSAEGNKPEAQELELWERISTTEGLERAEVLEELSQFAFKKNDFKECLQLIDTSIDIYFSLQSEFHTKELIHLYEGKSLCHSNMDQSAESAAAFEVLAGYFSIEGDREGFSRAKRSAAREWYSAKEWEKSLEGHLIASQEVDPDATDYSMGIDHLNIGMALHKLERHEEAITHYLQGRELFKKAKSPEYVNWCDGYVSECYYKLGNAAETLFHANHFMNYCIIAENKSLQGYAHQSMGQGLWLNKEYGKAEDHFTRSLNILTAESKQDWKSIIEITHNKAACLFALGENDWANKVLDRIATIEETIELN